MSAGGDDGPIAIESVIARVPFTVRRIVRWSECDPAGVVYVGNFPQYMLSTAQLFRQLLFGGRPGSQNAGKPYGTPGKAISMVFLGSLWPGDHFDMAVYLGTVGQRTSDVLVHGFREDNGSDVFVGRVTSIYVSSEDRKKTVGIPDEVRSAFDRYRTSCPPPPKVLDQVGR